MDDVLLAGLGDVSRGTWADAFEFVRKSNFRTTSYFSFAVQAKLIGADPVVSRCVNIGIHAVNAMLVLAVTRQIANHCGYRVHATTFAALVALVWVALPIHATTVLYPIQRMTLLAATGSLVIFLCVLGKPTAPRMALAFTAYILAILAKENAILAMPVALVLRGLLSANPLTRSLLFQALALLSAAFIGLILWFNVELEIPLRYSAWDFGLLEHMLMAPRVIAAYAVSIIAPNPNDFSFYYDDFMAANPRPLSWLYLIPLVLAPVGFLALYQLSRWNKLAAAGIAIYVLLHTVEGTALALDLYFEHRNYLPSLGLALALVSILMPADVPLGRAKTYLLATYFVLLLSALGYRTHLIGNEVALTRHHLETHPASFRSMLDAAYFGVAVAPSAIQSFPYPIELEAIALRSKCTGVAPPPAWSTSSADGFIPNRSLRLHADTLSSCANSCAVPNRYLDRLANAYLLDERKDSYRKRFEDQMVRFKARRRDAFCE